jgi:tetrahydromethanopterin S-methyltransferase subunit G
MPKRQTVHNEPLAAKTRIETGRRLQASQCSTQQGGKRMANEPDNLALEMLREIRARLDRHEARFDKMDKRFDKLDKKLDDMAGGLTYSLGFSMQANLRHENVQKKLDALEQRVERLEQRV